MGCGASSSRTEDTACQDNQSTKKQTKKTRSKGKHYRESAKPALEQPSPPASDTLDEPSTTIVQKYSMNSMTHVNDSPTSVVSNHVDIAVKSVEMEQDKARSRSADSIASLSSTSPRAKTPQEVETTSPPFQLSCPPGQSKRSSSQLRQASGSPLSLGRNSTRGSLARMDRGRKEADAPSKRMLLRREGSCCEEDETSASLSYDPMKFKRIHSGDMSSSMGSATPLSQPELQPLSRSASNNNARKERSLSRVSDVNQYRSPSGLSSHASGYQQSYALPTAIISNVRSEEALLDQTICSQYEDELSSSSSTTASTIREKVRRTMPGRCELMENSAMQLIEEAVSMQQDYLEVDHCELTELPDAMHPLSESLSVLMATHNTLREIPQFITDFTLLRTLSLAYNEIELLPEDFGLLVNLTEVDLSHNNIKDVPASLSELRNLRMFNLDFNDVREFPDHLLALQNIEEVYLAENHRMSTMPDPAKIAAAKLLTQVALDNIPCLMEQYTEDYKAQVKSDIFVWNKIWPDKVLDYMYIGSLRSAQTTTIYEQESIKYVVTCGRNMQINTAGVVRLELGVEDVEGESLLPHFDAFRHFVESSKGRGNVLVHCFAGLSRSATMVLSYLVSHEGMRLDDAMAKLVSIRPNVHPNATFMKELLALDASLHANERPLDMTLLGEERTLRRLQNATTGQAQAR